MEDLHSLHAHLNGIGSSPVLASTDNLSMKRQRRPSVRLGEIGDHAYHSHAFRGAKQWKPPSKDSNKLSRSRPVPAFELEVTDSKLKRRVKSTWISDIDERFSGSEDVDDGFADFNSEDSDSGLKELSPVHSQRENDEKGVDRVVRARVSDNRDVNYQAPLEVSEDRDGVRVWLNQLGLGRYAPVFEVHEVDDEVLAMLTLEDLKDMGIAAVGSRRKMFSAIQKLNRGFS
ncbi:ankyrin repeat and SAM domain-containing protein 3-like [Impatiens glandulifera]|uniref:ankyrin repeat and SAM domain-containing protein 3-like n=1 Tax=Impatiens glandulifera TaxID=253017 RepID=UPI001FB04C0E|nr:ankyrin repeat and SAM domain-containing protein 3-like [Impatiens glandulifera]